MELDNDWHGKDKDRSAKNKPLVYSNNTQMFDARSMGTIVDSQSNSYDTESFMTPRAPSHQHQNSGTFSTFGETECGEPMRPQHIVLDFTPTEEDEVEEVRQKCLDFWEFFENSPELQELIVDPDPDLSKDMESSCNADLESTVTMPAEYPPKREKTAMSFLEEFAEKDILAGLFSCKMPGSGCSLRSREYQEHDPMTRGIKSMEIRQPCRCIGTCNQTCKKLKKLTTPEVQLMSKNLNKWTKDHPKSMEPPGHAPELKHAVMQRRREPIVPPKIPPPQSSIKF